MHFLGAGDPQAPLDLDRLCDVEAQGGDAEGARADAPPILMKSRRVICGIVQLLPGM